MADLKHTQHKESTVYAEAARLIRTGIPKDAHGNEVLRSNPKFLQRGR